MISTRVRLAILESMVCSGSADSLNGSDGDSGFEYYSNPNDRSAGHITWVSGGRKSWTLNPAAVGPNPRSQVSQRLITEEPMAMVSPEQALIVANVGANEVP